MRGVGKRGRRTRRRVGRRTTGWTAVRTAVRAAVRIGRRAGRRRLAALSAVVCAALTAGLLAGPAAEADAGRAASADANAAASRLPGGRYGSDRHLATWTWRLKNSGTDARFRGLAAVSRKTAWVAGTKGTVLRTSDGGGSWRNISPPGAVAEGLELRDIEAFDARRAVVLAIGEGTASRVFRTADGGENWTESFRNPDPRAFYDCMTFFDTRHGLALSDPVDGKYRILSTGDGGRSWHVLPSEGMPAAQPGEAAFAASGQCLVSSGRRDVWIATGGAAKARILHSADRGLTWSAADAPIPAGDPARGVFALAFRDRTHESADGRTEARVRGIAVGGDYRPDQSSPKAAAVSDDAGAYWRLSAAPPPAYRSGVAWLPHSRRAVLAVGPSGMDMTMDGGRTWRAFDTGTYDTVDCAPDLGCWAAGEKGRVARLES